MKPPDLDLKARQHYLQRLAARGVPEHLHEGLIDYFTKGLLPGDFLRAVLNNDFVETIRRGDEVSLAHLPQIAEFMHFDAPPWAWGNHGRVLAWQATLKTGAPAR